MSNIFISYSSKDREWVKSWLLPKLEGAGFGTHIDYRDFKIGVPSLNNMERAVDECDKTLLVLTPNWVNSEWTNFESLMLQTDDPTGLTGRIVPLMLEKCKPPKRLAIFTYADFKDEANWESEMSRLISQLGPPVSPEPAVATPSTNNISIYRLPTTGAKLFGREKEMRVLNKAWKDKHTSIVSLIAWGGVGKTSLVNEWLNRMEKKDYKEAKKVYGWSFYSQGAA
ncbi:MAG: toll/interleukin-1 receptor domain-containing protein, partial [bacterium]|nr:toll/interleukin-1 receptor domain-containing protein [bacterium]